jgi:hypothetical protein
MPLVRKVWHKKPQPHGSGHYRFSIFLEHTRQFDLPRVREREDAQFKPSFHEREAVIADGGTVCGEKSSGIL